MTPAECNLEFISTYLKGRPPSAPIRTFVDDWFAYQMGGPFLSKFGRPLWFNKPCPKKKKEALLKMHFISERAKKVIDNEGGADLKKEHAIPVKVLRDLMLEIKNPTTSNVKQFLLKHYKLGVLTASEDKKLREAGLQSKMPEGWDGVDMFARYSFVGIENQQNSLSHT